MPKTLERRRRFFDVYPDLKRYYREPKYEQGPWRIERFTLEADFVRFEQLHDTLHGRSYETRWLEPGEYVRLVHRDHGIVMSDTAMEKVSNLDAVREAHGRVLLAGLGLGMVLLAIQEKPEVEAVTVVEIDQDLIDLVTPLISLNNKVQVVNADILGWKPPTGAKYTTIYFDIWDSISGDHNEQMVKLNRRFWRYKISKEAFMKSWRQKDMRDLAYKEVRP